MNIITKYFSKINANHQFRLGLEEHRKGRIENAIQMFSRALNKYENHLPSLYSRGSLYIDIAQWDKALIDLEKVKKLDPKAQNIDFLMGISNCSVGNNKLGLELLSNQLKSTPNNIDVFWNRALVYNNTGEYDKALIDIDKSIHYNNDNSHFHCIKAEILDNLKQFAEAEKHFDKAIELEKKPGDALMVKIEFLIRNDKIDEAISGLDKMLEQYPHEGLLFMKRGDLKLLNKDNESAITDYKLSLQKGCVEAKTKLKKHCLTTPINNTGFGV